MWRINKINNLATNPTLHEYQRAIYGHLKHNHFDNGRMIGRDKDCDAFSHLRFFPNLIVSYKHGNI